MRLLRNNGDIEPSAVGHILSPYEESALVEFLAGLRQGETIELPAGKEWFTAEEVAHLFGIAPSPVEGLKLLGVDASEVEDVIISHLHYDHFGNFDLFPN